MGLLSLSCFFVSSFLVYHAFLHGASYFILLLCMFFSLDSSTIIFIINYSVKINNKKKIHKRSTALDGQKKNIDMLTFLYLKLIGLFVSCKKAHFIDISNVLTALS